MEVKEDNSILINAVLDIIALLEDALEKEKKTLKMLRESQISIEEITIGKEKNI